MKTFAVFFALATSAAFAARVELITLDLERPQQPFSLAFTESTSASVSVRLLASGAEFDPSGWTGLLWYGTSNAGGVTLTNSASGYGQMSWAVPVSSMPTNARYSAQIIGTISNRVEEWGRGALTVRLSPSRGSLPAQWMYGDPAYAAATNAAALIAAHAARSDNPHGVSAAQIGALTNAWQNPASSTNWTWTSDGCQITLTGYNYADADVAIPDMLDGLPVTGLGDALNSPWYQVYNVITSLSGGNNIRSLNAFALSGHASLAEVSLLNVTNVGVGTFLYCESLTRINFGSSAPPDNCDYTALYDETPAWSVYIVNPAATGWGSTWCARPVVRVPITSGLIGGNGAGITNIPAAAIVGLPAEQDAAALAAIAALSTNRTTALWSADNSQYIDGTGGVWRVTWTNESYYTLTFTNSLAGWESGTLLTAGQLDSFGYWTDYPPDSSPGREYPDYYALSPFIDSQTNACLWRLVWDSKGDCFSVEAAPLDENLGYSAYWLGTTQKELPQVLARYGVEGETLTLDYVTRAWSTTNPAPRVAFMSDIPTSTYPTNYVAGFALPVPGTNAVYTLSVSSNFTLSVWSTTP